MRVTLFGADDLGDKPHGNQEKTDRSMQIIPFSEISRKAFVTEIIRLSGNTSYCSTSLTLPLGRSKSDA